MVGAHLVAGSLIKNPGGTIALSGGYIAGRARLVGAAAARLSAPGVEGGATLNQNRAIFQGLFHAPQVVGEALKGAHLVAHVMTRLGFECNPAAGAPRTDIIQAVRVSRHLRQSPPISAHLHQSQPISIRFCSSPPTSPRSQVRLGQRERVVAFCRAVQLCSPVGAHILPVPGVTPGYGDEVIDLIIP